MAEGKRPYRDGPLIEAATRLYVQEGLTVEEISTRIEDVSRRTLEDWSVKFGWVARRRKYLSQENDLRAYHDKAKLRLARMLASDEEFDPQAIYALARGVAVLEPVAAIKLRELDKAEKEAAENRFERTLGGEGINHRLKG